MSKKRRKKNREYKVHAGLDALMDIVKSTKNSPKAWIDFLEDIKTAMKKVGCKAGGNTEPWFRGHSRSDYKLIPSLLRYLEKPDKPKNWDKVFDLESDLFWEFASRARELHGVIEDDWDILSTMQHYLTPTRLLDWTEILGVAIYFAILGVNDGKSKGSKDGDVKIGPPPCIWVLNPYRLNHESGWGAFDKKKSMADLVYPANLGWDKKSKSYYSYGDLLTEGYMDWKWPVAIYPRQRNARVHAQRGWFTIHGDKFVPIEEIKGHKKYAQKVELPFAAVPEARKFLEASGINHYLLFADLESLSLHLMEKNGYLTRSQAEVRIKQRLDRRNVPGSVPRQ
jgi:hypothetical protein